MDNIGNGYIQSVEETVAQYGNKNEGELVGDLGEMIRKRPKRRHIFG